MMKFAKDTTTEPYVRDLEYRGFVEGLIVKDISTNDVLCHYFGGIPYASPPVGAFRWRRPRPLAVCYRYGTKADPGKFTDGTSICPQPGSKSDQVDEDCLELNIWIPAGEPPKGGWPVYFYIHGGFLQFGHPNSGDLTSLLSSTSVKAIIVKPAYRLNVIGFLASKELLNDPANLDRTVGNLGFWDQRLALEWTYKNISYFSGNPSNITIGGYSAGAHSAFHQLAYDLWNPLPSGRPIARRCVMHSNSPGPQPKNLSLAQEQFNVLIRALDIPSALPAAEKLSRLRALPPDTLLKASMKLKLHTFRAVTDGTFIRQDLYQSINDGTFAKKLLAHGIELMIGECRDEWHVYGAFRPPVKNTPEAVFDRLCADFSPSVSAALLDYYSPGRKLPSQCKSWRELFGRLFADINIHALERGFINKLDEHGAGGLIHRYRIEWRAKCCDRSFPKQWGVTHGTDGAIWFYGDGQNLEEDERDLVKNGFLNLYGAFLRGESIQKDWGLEGKGVRVVRRLKGDGSVDVWEDTDWEKGLEVWELVSRAGKKDTMSL
ncbi:paraben-hydrolyzing esterase precursor [Aulographum hederae CBS 113979]|uniref:Paraben-hydrolyzing esterase n=1 Tax=Aulographum hederae CBS 113979 TaxID=1176131 RepID=A0A6G1H9P5_9PEZI|nr:paraben-hydrolyzing esterase precursor [Aulographum hederae CBS 113979]